MTKLQHLLHTFCKPQTVKTSILTILFVAVCAPLFAQTVNTIGTSVFYTNGASADDERDEANGTSNDDRALYCNGWIDGEKLMAWPKTGAPNDDRSFVVDGSTNPTSNATVNDPWVSSALIEYDQPYPAPEEENKYPNHCLGLCASYACSNLPVGQTTYSVSFPLQRITFDIFKYYNGKNPKNADELPSIRSIDVFPAQDISDPSKYTCGSYRCSNAGKDDTKNSQISECLGAHWVCDGTTSPTEGGTGITCGVTRDKEENGGGLLPDSTYCWSGSGTTEKDWTAFISCGIDSSDEDNKTVICVPQNGTPQYNTNCAAGSSTKYCQINNLEVPANATGSLCWPSTTTKKVACGTSQSPLTHGQPMTDTNKCYAYYGVSKFSQCQKITTSATQFNGCCEGPGHSDCVVFDGNGAETNEQLNFCTGWDGFYEIAGEFGKSNGQFGYRATAYTNVPSDGVIADRIEIQETGVYPGHNGASQIPIQIDVTNVHTVRSTPTLIGTITPVSAQPYTFTYRLSKDADVRIAIFDASTLDTDAYAWTDVNHTGNQTSFALQVGSAADKIVRTLVDWQPRTGEGMKGNEKDTQIADFDSWDGRNDLGMLLPAGNYLASVQAKSQDEWPGVDFSRAVTRQVSLDPLKLTDVQVTGLNKKSTAYATISYVPTESATVYWEVYTPGTDFKKTSGTDANGNQVSATFTNSAAPTGTGPTLDTDTNNKPTGSLVYRHVEQKTRRMNYIDKWDGTCQATKTNNDGTVVPTNCVRTYMKDERMSNGSVCKPSGTDTCTETFAYGAPMPDGNYVYVLWAEIPYNGCYYNAAADTTTTSGYYGKPHFDANKPCGTNGQYTAADNNKQFTGVKTLKYTVGTLELERGLVGITMQPASYATLGSSPTAYGLDPFIFKYSLDRDAQVVATVENTAGVVVKYLTLQEGEPNVSQQLNTLTWDGRDEQGRMVYPGTYMFRVKAMDAMFPAQRNEAITVFPVDMYRVVDVSTTDVYGDSNAKATISYHLSKTMNAQVNIYNKDVVIPHYNSTTGEYNQARVIGVYNGKKEHQKEGELTNVTITPQGGTETNYTSTLKAGESVVTYDDCGDYKCRNTWTVAAEHTITGDRDLNQDLTNLDQDPTHPNHNNEPYATENADGTGSLLYTIYLKQEKLDMPSDANKAWPPHICATNDPVYGIGKAKDIFYADNEGTAKKGAVNPAKVNQYQAECIYVNDKTFTHYPTMAQDAANVVDVRLQPIHTFDRSSLRIGDDGIVMEEWDALYFYNPTPDEGRHTEEEINRCKNSNEKANCPYEMVPDGQYPFFISARSNEPFNRYYYDQLRDGKQGSATYNGKNFKGNYTISGEPFRRGEEFNCGTATDPQACVDNIDVQQEDYLYASDKVVHKINVTRGPVYFLDGSVAVFPNAPQLFNASSTTLTFIPPYEINFSISRAAQVEVAIVALEDHMCSPVTDNVLSSNVNVYESRTNVAGEICKFLSTMTIQNTGHFDANIIRKMYWDGTDHTGNYVKPGIYEVRLTARNYPDAGLYQPTVKSITLNADLLKVFDLLENDNYAISERGQNMKIGYQVSVPMKVAIQIFKPGTTIYDYSKGTLRNPTTGKEVKDIREVLVRSIVGIRPGTTLVEEVWDGLDYAGQEVPDGIYPFRFVTSLDTAAIDSVTGAILPGDDESTNPLEWKIARVADTYEYQNLHRATIAIGDGRFVCEDWKKTVFFYPNPLNDASKGTLEITKMPVPGTVSIKYFNLAGDLVRNADYQCVDANNYQTTMGSNLYFQPDNNVKDVDGQYHRVDLNEFANVRNAALRCKWDRTNQHGKKVARGVYFGLVDFKAYNGREHCQKVVKILIP